MKALQLLLATALTTPALPALAQIVPVTEAGEYQIMKEESQMVCFAATDLLSQAKKPMIYTYYASKQGQRWNVAGYASEFEMQDGMIKITVAVDGSETISRETITRSGDFVLPFEALEEIEAHEALVKTGEVMLITIGDVDAVEVPLNEHRVALEAMASCLAGF